jgi:squalene-hopene/tetraprenyl-beta-curcumene cyclase
MNLPSRPFGRPTRLAIFCGVLVCILTLTNSTPLRAQSKSSVDPREVHALLDKAEAFLKSRQNADGSFVPRLGGPGISALIAAGVIRNGRTADDPLVAKTLKYLESSVKDDGGIYSKGLANYTTCVAMMAFKEANAGGKYDKVLANGAKFLKSLQNTGDPKELNFGGVGYEGKGRPDLSNAHFFVEAMLAAGVSKDDPAVQRALAFISRCQNLPGEHQDQEFASKAAEDDRGGFTYNPADASNEKSDRRTAIGGLRSEGGMTYAGLKSFLYAGVGRDDPRVKGALNWIRRHYTLQENPGQKDAGLYYYYHTFAKAMDALGEDEFTDADGTKHDWRKELFEALKKRQNADGSWTNSNGAFLENTPELATAYAILALSYCTQRK